MNDLDSAYFSKEGLAKLKNELGTLKTKKRKEIADRLEFAKSLGDLSENSEYQEAKESQILNEAKIAELEDMLRRAVVVEGGAKGQSHRYLVNKSCLRIVDIGHATLSLNVLEGRIKLRHHAILLDQV